jgi:ribosomal protein S19
MDVSKDDEDFKSIVRAVGVDSIVGSVVVVIRGISFLEVEVLGDIAGLELEGLLDSGPV